MTSAGEAPPARAADGKESESTEAGCCKESEATDASSDFHAAAQRAAELDIEAYEWRQSLEFHVNGRRVRVADAQPQRTLLSFLRRDLGLTGTKLGCGEGGCGACTVTVSHWEAGKAVHRAVNACLAPLCSVDGAAVTTVEGLGTAKRPHVVQERLAEMHGSQCGFCTPGVVMSLYSALCKGKPSVAEAEEMFDGNLCRCTGYRPILDAAKSFARDKESCPKAADGFEEGVCGSTQKNIAAPEAKEEVAVPVPQEAKGAAGPLKVVGERVTWYRPGDLAALLALRKAKPSAKIVAGNTEYGIEAKFKGCEHAELISTAAVAELQETCVDGDGGLVIGGAVTLAALEAFLEERKDCGFKAMRDMLRWFASGQIRNIAALAGNVVTASPISDMNPVLMALGATLVLASAGNAPREVAVRDFFKKYRTVDMAPEEVLCAVKVPPAAGDFAFCKAFKQARRRDDDISIVNACFTLSLRPCDGGWAVAAFSSGFGGMAPCTVRAADLEKSVLNMPWNEALLTTAMEALERDLPLPEGVPGGMAAYRQTLAASFFYKFYVAVNLELAEKLAGMAGDLPKAPAVSEKETSAARSFLSEERPVSHGSQCYHVPSGGMQKSAVAGGVDHAPCDDAERAPVGEPMPHNNALPQCTGEARYVDDLPSPPGCLHAVFVLSERPHAKLLSVDIAAAEAAPGVEKVFTAEDLSDHDNALGPIVQDELLFRKGTVTSTGQPIALVVAATLEEAERAAKLVKVEYEDLEAVISIEDAIKKESFALPLKRMEDGDVDAAFALKDTVTVEGELRIGGQEHFYLETNAALVEVGEGDELTIHCSTQNPMKTQKFAAHACGIPFNRVICRMKRMGGGFGGKETRTVFISSAVAFAAHRLHRHVRINVERDVDMWITGTRHPFIGRYKAGAGPDGKLRALELKLYSNAGFSMDLSGPVIDRAMLHSDNVYKVPNLRATGHICLTNTGSNTAFRGFGGPQGLLIAEAWMEHLSAKLNIAPEELRRRNFYGFEGGITHFYQKLERCPVQRLFEELATSSDFAKRTALAEEFNGRNRWRKRGLAMLPTKFGISFTAKFMNQAGALVHIYTDGTVLVTHGGTEMGQGLHTKMSQVVAKALGVPYADVYIRETATDTVPNSSPTAASASSDIYGMALLNACEQLKERLAPYLAKAESWKKAVFAAYFDRVDLSAHGFYRTPGVGYDWGVEDCRKRGQPFMYFTYGAACCEVEIDALSGDMRILRADILMDLGNSLNPAIDIGQIEGAFTQGVGWSTIEEVVWGCDELPWLKRGALFTRGPGSYKIPAFNDVPIDMRVSLLKDSPNKGAIHSSRAVGEPPLFLGASAYLAARQAVKAARKDAGLGEGHFTVDVPLTAERIRMACGDEIAGKFAAKGSRPRPAGFW